MVSESKVIWLLVASTIQYLPDGMGPNSMLPIERGTSLVIKLLVAIFTVVKSAVALAPLAASPPDQLFVMPQTRLVVAAFV